MLHISDWTAKFKAPAGSLLPVNVPLTRLRRYAEGRFCFVLGILLLWIFVNEYDPNRYQPRLPRCVANS